MPNGKPLGLLALDHNDVICRIRVHIADHKVRVELVVGRRFARVLAGPPAPHDDRQLGVLRGERPDQLLDCHCNVIIN